MYLRALLAILVIASALAAPNTPAAAASGGNVADAVLGQPDFGTNGCNTGGRSAKSLCLPQGFAQDPSSTRIFVADRGNLRVLSWSNTSAIMTGAPADLVIAQNDFSTAEPCIGPGAPSNPCVGPWDISLDAFGNLFVADLTHSRVLMYSAPLSNGEPPSLTLGAAAIAGCGVTIPTDARHLCRPSGLAVAPDGSLFVADTGNARVLRFPFPHSSDQAADLVLGQADFGSGDAAACYPAGPPSIPNQSSLCAPSGLAFDASGRLFVADTFNDRVVVYDPPYTNGQLASLVVGQPDFASKDQGCRPLVGTQPPNAPPGFTSHASERSLCEPEKVAVDPVGNLYVADTGNSRVLNFGQVLANYPAAVGVLGQPDFLHNTCNSTGLGPASLCYPMGVGFDVRGELYLADTGNNRVLRFD